MNIEPKNIRSFLFACCAALIAANAAAGTHTWTGAAANGLWSTPSNWESSNPPFANETPLHLVFPTTATKRLSTNNIGSITIDSMSFAGAAYTIAGSGQGTNVTIDTSVGDSWWNLRALSGTGHTLHSSLNLALEGTFQTIIDTSASVTIRSSMHSAVAGSGLSKDGPGTLVLAPVEDNTFDGLTLINDGLLNLQGSHLVFGLTVTDVTVPGPLTIGGTSPTLHPSCLVWLSGQIGDNSAVTVYQNGELNLADVDETIGSLTISGGYVDSGNGTLKLNSNVVAQKPSNNHPGDVRGHLDLGTFGRFFTVETNAYLDVSAVIKGGNFGNVPAGVNKLGPGWLALTSPSNTFGGELYVSQGTVSIRSGKELGAATNSTSVASNATLALSGVGSGPIVDGKKLNLQGGARLQALLDSEWNGPVQLYGKAIIDVPTNVSLTLGGVLRGVGGFTKTGPGELLLTGFEDNTFTGAACVDDGWLSLDKVGLFTNAIAISGPLVVGGIDTSKAPRAFLLADEEIAPAVQVLVNQNGQLQLSDHHQTVGALAVNGGLVNSGTFGVLNLAGDITSTNYIPYDGDIQGRLDLGSAPRSISVWGSGAWLNIHAIISGGPAASLTKDGWGNLDLFGANTYEGLTVISYGGLTIGHPRALGSPTAGTVVTAGAALLLDSYPFGQPSMTVTNEALTLSGTGEGDDAYNGALASHGTNIWQGVVTLISSDVGIRAETADDQLVLSVRIEGIRNLRKTGKGKVIFSGTGFSAFNNTYSGTTTVTDGELILAKQGGIFANTALTGDLSIVPYGPGSFPIVRVQGRQQFWGNNAVAIAPGGQLRIESPTYNSIGSLSGDGVVDFAVGSRLVCGINNQNSTFAGTLQGGGINDTNLSHQGTGIFTLAGVNTLAGKVEVTGGTLRVNGAQPAARVDVKFQGTLGGTGSVNVVTMRGGWLAPGSPLGKLHAGSCAAGASHHLNIDLNGPALGTGYDQLELDAAPNFASTQLGAALGNGFNPAYGQEFLIVRNNSPLPIAAPFLGLAQDAIFYVDDYHRVQISYLGGDGNDVVLKAVAGPGQLKGITTDGNRATINGCGTPGANYTVEANTDLGNPAGWVNIGTVSPGLNGLMQFVDADMAQYPHRFYRFVAP